MRRCSRLRILVETHRQSCFEDPIFGTLEVATALTHSQLIDCSEEENEVREKKGRRTKLARNLPDMNKDD
jgi:hypothetical protein